MQSCKIAAQKGSLHSASHSRPVNSKAEYTLKRGFEVIATNSPERGSVAAFGKCLRLQGHRPVGSHFLSAGEQSVIQRALAAPETQMPISVGDMPRTDISPDDFSFLKQLQN